MERPKSDRKDTLRELALRDMESLAQVQHKKQQTPLMRYVGCPEWQNAAALVLDAIQASMRQRRGTRLSPPPGWLPPF
jgi:hypothetical protein